MRNKDPEKKIVALTQEAIGGGGPDAHLASLILFRLYGS